MRPIKKILVAVKDLDAKASPEVAKAAQLAKALGAELEIFHAIDTPVYFDLYGDGRGNLAKIEKQQLGKQQAKLERIARRVHRHDVAVSTRADWDYPSHEAILRRAKATDADLIVVQVHRGHRGLRWLMRSTDWELLKLSPVPVLLVRTPRPYLHPRVLAAVDPARSHAKPARLNAEILGLAAKFSTALRGSLSAMHAYIPPSATELTLFAPGVPSITIGSDAMAEKHAISALRRSVAKFQIPAQRRHVLGQHPIEAIPKLTKTLKVSILVMGALSRSGLKRVFIGNTAEQIIDAIACDILIVRPAHIELKKIPDARAGMPLYTQPMPY